MSKKILFYILLFLSLLAFCTGAFYEVHIEGLGKMQLMDLLSSYYITKDTSDLLTMLLFKFKSIIGTWLIFFLCPFIPFSIILCLLIPLAKGFSLGFSATMIIEKFGLKGIWYITSSILPQGIFQLPIMCLLAIFSIDLSIIFIKLYTQKTQKKKNKNALFLATRHYVLVFILGLIAITISCIIEVFLTQFLL